MITIEDRNLYDEAEEYINKIDRIKDLQCSLWKKQVDGMNISSEDNRKVMSIISEAIEDCFWKEIRQARRIVDRLEKEIESL